MITGRVELINARTQGNLNGELLESKLKTVDAGKGKKRGAHKVRERADGRSKVVTSLVSETTFLGRTCVELTSGNLIPKMWLDVHQWHAGQMAPKEWTYALA